MLNNVLGTFTLILCYQELIVGFTATESLDEDKEVWRKIDEKLNVGAATTVGNIISTYKHSKHDGHNIVTDRIISKVSTAQSTTDNYQLKSTEQQSVESTLRSILEVTSFTKNSDDSQNVSTTLSGSELGTNESSATKASETSVKPVSTSSLIFVNESTSTPEFNRENGMNTDIEKGTESTKMSANKSLTELVQGYATQETTMSSSGRNITMATTDAIERLTDATNTITDVMADATYTTTDATDTKTDSFDTVPDVPGTAVLLGTKNAITSGHMLVTTESDGHINTDMSLIQTSSSKINHDYTTEQTLGQGDGTQRTTVRTISDRDVTMAMTGTTTEQNVVQSSTTAKIAASWNVKLIDVKPTSVKVLVEGQLPEGKDCNWVKIRRTTGDSVRTEEKRCSGNYFNKTFTIKDLEFAGECYPLEIFVTTKLEYDEIGPRHYSACTTPRRPHNTSKIQNRTTSTLTLQIVHPLKGSFDSFEIHYKTSQDYYMILANRSTEKTTVVELSPLLPGSCYDIDVYTFSNGERSRNPRTFTMECVLPLTPGQNHTVVFDQSSFTLSWLKPVGNVERYIVDVLCDSSPIYTYNQTKTSVKVSGITPGHCCQINVTTFSHQFHSNPQLYYVYVNESVPDTVILSPDVASKQKLMIVWSPPVISNGWLLGYNIQLYDSEKSEIDTFSIECAQKEMDCLEKFDQKIFQCLKYNLTGNRNDVTFTDNGTKLWLTIRNLQTGLKYYYTISAFNKIGSSSTSLIQVKTQEDKPSVPAGLKVKVVNTTSINITWLPPKTPNGVITKYKIRYWTGVNNPSIIEVDTDVNSRLLTDLDCWKKYDICVSAKTSSGYGGSICNSTVTDIYEPMSQIKNVVLSSSIRIEFEIPCEGLSINIIYNVSYVSLNHTCTDGRLNNVTNYQSCNYGDPCEITGLHSYWDYYIQVQETVENKVGPWSKPYTVKTNPASPGKVRRLRIASITSNSLTVCWERPCFMNSPSVIKYEVIVGNRTDMIEGTCNVIKNLSPFTMYKLSVVTFSDSGRSLPSYISGKTGVAEPTQPKNVTFSIAATRIRVAWSAVYPYPGPTNYTVNLRDVENEVATHSCHTPAFNVTYCTVNGLEEFWRYNVTVTAHTSKGSNSSLVTSVLTSEAAPGPVTNFNVEPEKNPKNPRQIHVRFSAPVPRDRNGQLKAYYVRCISTVSKKVIREIKLNNPSEVKIIMPEQHLLNISVFAETIQNGTEVYKIVIVPEGDKGFPVIEVVVGICTAIVVFAILGIILAIFYRKQIFIFKPKQEEKETVNLKAVNHPRKKISVETEDKRKNRPVKLDRFYQHVEILARDSNHFFSKEYKELKGMAPAFPTEAAEQQETRTKNRYSNILPFDHSRVKLLPLDDEEGSDYINANYIPGFNSKREYIATQGPLPSTKDDFWRMIWEQNVSVIVMLTQCVERGKRKCECYWPECVKEPVYYGDISIEVENESHLPEYVLRALNITLGDKQKRVMHFLYLAWPDMGVPSSTDNMISFVKTVRSHINPTMKGPLTVHCSAGVGRTGTFIAVDILLHQLDNDNNLIDIFGDVLQLRNHRCNMVQTEDQYIFIHHCISDYILALSEESDEEEAIDGGDEPMYQNVPPR